MKIKKILLATMLIGTLIMSNAAIAFASEATPNLPREVTDVTDVSEKATPRISFENSNLELQTKWIEVVRENNVFGDRPTVTNGIKSPGYVNIRVIDVSSGNEIGNMKTCQPGQSAKLDSIPFDIGVYKIEMSAGIKGNYHIKID